jgi:hypothetical protein
MSYKALGAVLNHTHHKGDEQLVLIWIAWCINRDTGEAFPGIDYLMNKTGFGRTKVKEVLNRLRVGGEVEIISGSRKGCKTPNHYRLNSMTSANRSDGEPINRSHVRPITMHPNRSEMGVGIGRKSAPNRSDGGPLSCLNLFKKPVRAVASAPAHAKKIRRPEPKTP